MVCIRYRHNNQTLVITPSKVLMGRGVSGTEIAALMKSGDYMHKPFGGIVDNKAPPSGVQPVKLVNITCFWETESPFEQGYEIPLSHVVKGFYIAGKYFIAISRAKPIHWLERSRVRESKNNIYDLQQLRMRKKNNAKN